MATWTAKCWLGSKSGYQDLQVQSNTVQGAKEQFENIYGTTQILNIRQVRSGSGGSSSPEESIGVGGVIVLTIIAFTIWLFVEYTPFVVMGVLGLVGVWIGKKFESMSLAFILAIALGAVGFYLGTDWSVETDGINTSPQQIEDSQPIREAKPVEDSPSTFAPDPVENSESIPEPSRGDFYYFPSIDKTPLEDSSTLNSPEIAEPTELRRKRRQIDCGDNWGRRRRC